MDSLCIGTVSYSAHLQLIVVHRRLRSNVVSLNVAPKHFKGRLQCTRLSLEELRHFQVSLLQLRHGFEAPQNGVMAMLDISAAESLVDLLPKALMSRGHRKCQTWRE